MESKDDDVKDMLKEDARARNISHNMTERVASRKIRPREA